MTMRITGHARMWICDGGDFELAGERSASVWEPLQINVPLSARAQTAYSNVIVFYDEQALEVGRCTHYGLTDAGGPHLLHAGGRWWEVVQGRVVQRNGFWCVQWHLRANTRRAQEANTGREMTLRAELAVKN